MNEAQKTLNALGRLVVMERPLVMGVLNLTPDSFYDGGKYTAEEAWLHRAGQMIAEGADMLDVGGMSTRPGAEAVSVEEELRRVIPAIERIHDRWPQQLISVDTVRAEVARRAMEAGASIINDVSAGRFDAEMYDLVAESGAPYILMHMQGRPPDMQRDPQYDDVVMDVLDFFIREVNALRRRGVRDIILDPGFGFGKTLDHNYELLNRLHVFGLLDLPILAGLSRKSMVYRLLGKTPGEALAGTTALHMVALQQGASILRVHDVAEARDVVDCWLKLKSIQPTSVAPWPTYPRTT